MADVFDIDSSGYHGQQKRDDYNNRNTGGWVPVETNSVSRKDPRLNRRDDGRKHYSPGESPLRSPQRMSKSATQMYNQMPPAQQYQQQAPPPPPMYSEYNSGYGTATTSYTHSYQQSYQQTQNNSSFGQYNQQSSYPSQNQGYNSGQHQQPGPPGDEYPNSWAPVPLAYPNMSHPPPPPVPRPSSVASTAHTSDSKTDDLKKEAAIAQEMKQQRATLIKQRDEYLRKASVLRRELEKLRMQKHELLADKSPPRDSQRILRENAKLQLEIQNKLKSINNVVDMLSGIIGDGLKAGDEDVKTNSNDSSPKRSRKHAEGSESEEPDARSGKSRERERERSNDDEWPHYNYIHYDPELHWCRVCDVFPRSAKDFLNHLHSAEHRQVTQEHQLVDTPWHKLPTDPELPSYKGAPVKRVPIKGLQFFISATSWYCKLCDVWIGDLHCASLHLKSKNHSHNYSNFVEQNPHWETNWLKDREKAVARTKGEAGLVPPAPEPPVIKEKLNKKQLKSKDSSFLESSKEKKRRKKSKKRKKNSSDSSSSSSSSDSSTEDESDKAKSIRVAMRNKMRMQAQMILNEEIGGKLEALRGLVEEKRNRETVDEPPPQQESIIEDNIINQWMTVTTNNDKHILDNLKGRLKQRQEADKEKSIEAAAEQRRREREREERELKEMREREQRELEEKMREEREREERDREERERIKERERNRRKRRSDSRSPERERYGRGRSHSRGRSRSRSIGRRHYGRGRSPERFFRDERRDNRDRRRSPEDNFKPRKPTYDEDEYDKHEDYKGKGKRLVSTLSSSRKLPFIGRMPLFKKRSDGEEKEIKKEDYEIRLSKFEPGNTARAFIPEPGVVHITKLATPQELIPYQSKINAENPPPPPKIIPEPPQISETAPPPPMINDVVTIVEETGMEVQDMELDEAAPPLPPGVPVAEAKPLAKPAGNHLPRDFQDALNIIFPGDQPHAADPNLMMQYQYQMGYGMMYPGMQMYDYSTATEETAVEAEATETKEATAEPEQIEEKTELAQPGVDDKEDLAMLGIDAEDMAAQTF